MLHHGRECEVKLISNDKASEFLEKYHIQGKDRSVKLSLGIYLDDQLLGVMTGGLHPQQPNSLSKDFYLNRLAFKSDVTVIGGSSKLFKHFCKYAQENGYTKIISWSDNRWSEGGIYKALGFSYVSQKDKGKGLIDGSMWPEFKYIQGYERITKERAKKLGMDEDLDKIYDCGKKVWEKILI